MKIFIITDERCGGTVFTRIFTDVFKLRRIHDPQTNTKKKLPDLNYKHTNLELFNYCYNVKKFNVIKCCYCSFSFKEYIEIIEYASSNNIKIIFLHRENFFDRALSIAVARTLKSIGYQNTYGYKDTNIIKPYNLNLDIYRKELIRHNKDYRNIMQYLKENKISYYYITFDELYINGNRLNNHIKLYKYLDLPIHNIENNNNLLYLINLNYNTKNSNKLIINFKEIININREYLKLNT